ERDGLKLALAVTLYEGSRYALVELALYNAGEGARNVGCLTPLSVAPGGSFGRGMSARSALVFINSYTNVGYRGVVPLLPLPSLHVPAALADGTGNLQVGNYSGWWVHAVWDGKCKTAFVVGALTAEKWKTSIQLKPDFLRNRFAHWQVDNLGNALLPAGATFRSEKILIGSYTDPLLALEEYASAVREVNGVRLREKAAGWCSWPYYYRKITAADVLRNAQFIKDKLGSRYPYILIDSGWFTCRGDWVANDQFPDGMAATARQIHGLGLKAGLWFAPFLVDKESALLGEHPDWFVRREDGSLYVYKQDMSAPDRYVLDGSHPAVQEWLMQWFARVVKEWGYEYLKLDFLHAGAVEGKRYDPSMTGMEALRAGLRAIRRGAGDEAYIQ
ncbi:MAG: alpha-galactosidase, partial [Chloroflexi bacterium]|nr:alpha-galactosidase [Chloroflexota bacterium]